MPEGSGIAVFVWTLLIRLPTEAVKASAIEDGPSFLETIAHLRKHPVLLVKPTEQTELLPAEKSSSHH